MWRHMKPILRVIILATAMLSFFFTRNGIEKYNKMSRKQKQTQNQ